MVTSEDIKQRWAGLEGEARLLFVVGGPGSGKSKLIRELAEQDKWKYVEAKDLIGEDFLEIDYEGRSECAITEISKALHAFQADVILVDGVEVLFAPILHINPVDILKELSKQYPIIVGWRGSYKNGLLSLEYNHNAEYYVCEMDESSVVVLG